MNPKYHLVGTYKTIPVYYSRTEGLLLNNGTEELEEPTELQKKMIIVKLGGIKGIELIVHNYEKSEAREAKQC